MSPLDVDASPKAPAQLMLMGPRQLSRLLQWHGQIPGDTDLETEALAEAWRAAGPIWHALSMAEAGVADAPIIEALPPQAQAHLQALASDESVRRTFDIAPVAFGWVPVAQLVVSQYTLTMDTLNSLGDAPAPEFDALLDLCLPLAGGRSAPSARLVHKSAREMVFVSDSHDLRQLDTRVIAPESLPGFPVRGCLDAVAGVCLGHSVNLVNVIRHADRLVLNNGHHRVHALWRQGVTHLPCLIQVCGSRDEVMEVAPRTVRDDFDLYFEAPRPPLLRDFDHPGLTRTLQTPRMRREIRVRFEIESRMVAC